MGQGRGNLKPARPGPEKSFKVQVAWLEDFVRKEGGRLRIERLDELTKAIACFQDEICREERAIASESRKNKFTLKRYWRAFLYGLATAGGVLVLDRLISTVFNLLN